MENRVNGNGNGIGHSPDPGLGAKRFSDVPRALDIPVGQGDDAEAVEVDLEELQSDPTELCMLLENEDVAHTFWTTIALAYAKTNRIDTAIEVVTKGLHSVGRNNAQDKLPLFNFLCWMYLLKARAAPRTTLDVNANGEIKTKEFYLRAATSALNDTTRISPSYSPSHLARGVLSLLRAALMSGTSEKNEALRQALKAFDDSLKASHGMNMLAIMGRSRVLYSLTRYAEALQGYQYVLEHAPDIIEPDPRIGIGCCAWMLGFREDAQVAWQRAVDLIASVLLGLYNLQLSSQFSTTDPQFAALYKKAMVQYIQESYKLDNKMPLACASFGSYFLIRRGMAQVENLAKRAVELTDVNSVASDGWYLLARKEHYGNDLSRAGDYYSRADQARGGEEAGFLPAKFGGAQIRVLMGDPDGAKFRLEKIVQRTKNVEAMTLLGALWAEDAFSGRIGNSKEEIIAAQRRAVPLLEQVRQSWKDPKRNAQPDISVLLNLARLYEAESPDKALACLEQVEQLEIDELPDDAVATHIADPQARIAAIREQLPPQLLNNIACFHYQAERHGYARDLFQIALNACVKLGDKDPAYDTDALVTTISYNLARTYEADDLLDEAKQVYQGLLARHDGYLDAQIRLTYIALRQNPTDEGVKSISQLYETESTNLEVRSLFGWYLRRAKRKTSNIAEDQEQRHYKHTLQGHDKHDRYSLTAMGNMYLGIAREMRRDTEQEKERRRKMYERSIEFFDKALQLDPRNAYAAQGIGIALIEDKKDFNGGLQIFTKVRETIKDASVFINLGHAYCELKQYTRAIEAYDAALAKDSGRDSQIFTCLGKAWLQKGRQEKSAQAMRTSLEFSQKALDAAPGQSHLRFNVAFVQIQIAQLLISLPEVQRTLEEVEQASQDLDEAIESFIVIAKAPNPPYPRNDLEQRANMGRNTMKRQLERAVQSQKEYDDKNATRLQQARETREADIAKKEEDRRAAEAVANAQRQKILEERRALEERDRQLAEARAEEQKRKEEGLSEDEEKKQRRREKQIKRKKKVENVSDGDERSDPGGDDEGGSHRKKKRKLTRSKSSKQYKSAEFVVDDDDDDEPMADGGGRNSASGGDEDAGSDDEGLSSERELTPDIDLDEPAAQSGNDNVRGPLGTGYRRKAPRVIDEDEDADANDAGGEGVINGAAGDGSDDE